MKFVFASDSFKGSLSSRQIISLLEQEARRIFPGCETVGLPMADGGEGTMDALLEALQGSRETLIVQNPRFQPISASYGLLPQGGAIIEMAQASGLPLLPKEQQDPEQTTTFGTGELIAHALKKGCRDLYLAIGGSATNDGGMGALCALGAVFLDKDNQPLPGIGASLGKVHRIDLSGLLPQIRETRFHVLCDVNNPLLGPSGASTVFAPQKGADEQAVQRLEKGMDHYAKITTQTLGKDCSLLPGAGAAGGLGFALLAFLGAELSSGVETVLRLLDFDHILQGTDWVITGEGRMDSQSPRGKVISGVVKHCAKAQVPTMAIVGSLGDGYESLLQQGLTGVITTVNRCMALDEAFSQAETLYSDAAFRVFSMIKNLPGYKGKV